MAGGAPLEMSFSWLEEQLVGLAKNNQLSLVNLRGRIYGLRASYTGSHMFVAFTYLQVNTAGPTELFEDNQGAIAMTKNPVRYKRTKHIEVKHQFVREVVQAGKLS